MLGINMSDVINVLSNCAPYLIFFAVVLVAAIVVSIAVRKQPKPRKKLVRKSAAVVTVAALVIAVNLICWGPMSSIITLATGTGASVSDETTTEAEGLATDIADEGIVMLKNTDGELPLASSGQKLNVFGWASTNPIYGGTGSGSMNDAYPTTTLLQGLNDAGIETNTELSDFYTSYLGERPTATSMLATDWSLPEPPASTYSDEMVSNAQSFSDTALVVIGRSGGEGNDLPSDMSTQTGLYQNSTDYADFDSGESYLTLSQSEEDMLDLVCSKFDNVIVLYNGANAMPLGWTENYPQIKSVLWFAGAGQTGFDSLGKVLTGEVNPSGKTSDTFVYDLASSPSYNNVGNFTYDNMSEFSSESAMGGSSSPSFVNYVEGIYVGYKYYETASTEGAIDYDSTVQYPFGYGLSYTTFDQKMGDIKKGSDGSISFDVTVTNTGSVAGKSVVETYYNPPYTNGGLEKASANLVYFGKTDELQPGESTTVTISFNEEDMASYDTSANGGEGSYVLEGGDYVISINSDSHTILDQRTYTVGSTITYSGDNKRSTDEVAATNEFEDAGTELTTVSRANHFANYDEATAAPSSLSMSDARKALFTNTSNYDSSTDDDGSAMPTTGANNGVTLSDLRGKDYDDPEWDTLLDQLSVDDMNSAISMNGYSTAAINSVGKVSTTDCDGPSAINNNFTGKGSIGFPSNTTLACTWNKDLAKSYGSEIGTMANEMGVSGWYAPAMNIHRNALSGRNFEYYSEDSLLSGDMAAQAELGASEKGVYGYIKHFALNDQETNRTSMLCTWANEQSIREIYLKPFEICVKDGDAHAVMSSFNYIGGTWTGGCSELLQDVLRGEWGFDGFVETDYYMAPNYMNADQAVRNGGDSFLATVGMGTNTVQNTDASGVNGLRNACHDIMYTVVNSSAYAEGADTGMPTWEIIAIVVDVIVAALLVLLFLKAFKTFRKASATDAAEDDSTKKNE